MMEQIKRILDTRKAIEYYGFKINNSGFINCPFHQDKSPSLKIYDNDRGFSCFGCGANGSVIDFIMRLFNLNYHQAIVRISNDFNLNIVRKKADKRDILRYQRLKREEARRKQIKDLVFKFIELEWKKNYLIYHSEKPRKVGDEITDSFANSLIQMRNCELMLLGE